ncbi:unnamed protein product [Cochlearia groenlandica]
MSLSEEEISIFHRVHKTLHQMLRDRGYIVTDSETDMTKEEFVQKYGWDMKREDLVTLKINKNDHSDKISVFFPEEDNIKTKQIKSYVKRMKSDKVSRAILVVKKDLTKYALDALTVSTKHYIEFFQEKELLMNVKEHAFVPVHQALTNEEKKALLEKYTVKENQLPRIRHTDPIAKYFGLKHGQVVKIIRQSEISGKYVTYRYVV